MNVYDSYKLTDFTQKIEKKIYETALKQAKEVVRNSEKRTVRKVREICNQAFETFSRELVNFSSKEMEDSSLIELTIESRENLFLGKLFQKAFETEIDS